MPSAKTGTAPLLHWGVATLALAGQQESGDLHLVKPLAGGALVAVVDGLGHGEDAAFAAKTAVRTLERYGHEPPLSVLQRCHEALIGTRGVVLSLASFDSARATMTWLGVGNVEGVLQHADWSERSARVALVTRGGIVGGDLPGIQAAVVPVAPGDTLVFATDGVRHEFTGEISMSEPPQRLADTILARFGKGTDDALVLVARYLGHR